MPNLGDQPKAKYAVIQIGNYDTIATYYLTIENAQAVYHHYSVNDGEVFLCEILEQK